MLNFFEIEKAPVSQVDFSYLLQKEQDEQVINSIQKNQLNRDLVAFKYFSVLSGNQTTFYLNCQKVHRPQKIGFKIEEITQLFQLNITIKGLCSVTGKWITLKSEFLDKNLIRQIKNSLQDKYVCFDTSMFEFLFKFYKVDVTLNFIPVYDYQQFKSLQYGFQIEGN